MRKVKFILALFIAAMMIVPAFADAAIQIVPPYPTTFWVYGTLRAPAGAEGFDLSGYRVVLYLKNAERKYSGYGYGDTNAQGQFMINAHSDLQMLPLQVKDYYFGVVNGGPDKNYGINEKTLPFVVADLSNGYKSVDAADLLTLVAGEGIQDPTVTDTPGGGPVGPQPPAGTVPLTITRVDSNIKISWTTVGAPDVYTLIGDGNGKYTNNVGGWDAGHPWTKIDFASNPAGFDVSHVNEGYILQTGQAGEANIPEVYYKALEVGKVPVDFLPQAWAVGMLKVTIYGNNKYNMIGIPLIQKDTSINAVLSDNIKRKDIEIQKFDNEAQGYQGASYDGANWGGQNISLQQGDSCWVYNPLADNIDINIVGNVGELNKSIRKTISGGSKYNMLTLPIVQGGSIVSVGLVPQAGSEVQNFDNNNQIYVGTIEKANNWENGSLGIIPGHGFWFYNIGNDLNWDTSIQ